MGVQGEEVCISTPTTRGRMLTSSLDMRQHSRTLEASKLWKEALYLYAISFFICIVASCNSYWPFHFFFQNKKEKKEKKGKMKKKKKEKIFFS